MFIVRDATISYLFLSLGTEDAEAEEGINSGSRLL